MTEPLHWFLFYFFLGLLLGTALYRSDFCLAGILRDFFLFRDHIRLTHLLLAVIVTALLFVLAAEAGLRPFDALTGFRTATVLGSSGGLIFGFGMVLAGGCVFSSLYKMGGGNLTYLLVFGGIVCGSLLYAELFPWLRVRDVPLLPGSLRQLWPWGHRPFGLILLGALTVLVVYGRRRKFWCVDNEASGYLQPLYVALVLAGANGAAYLLSGWPLGISTAYAKLGAFFEVLLVPAHAAGVVFFQQVSLEMTSGDLVMSGRAGPQWDLYANTEGALFGGILLGAFVNALLLREFRVHGWPPPRQGLLAFGGGVLLALGARLAQGCNIKHLLGGVPLLSSQSILFVVFMLVGIKLGTLVLPRLLLR
ncbi:MAG: YeeE/YedE family protein [Pelovirga sp.]